MDGKDPVKPEEEAEEDREAGSDVGEEDRSGDELDPLTPAVLPMKDSSVDDEQLTSAEEKVLKKLRKQRSNYEDDGEDEQEKADMNGKMTNNAELSPLDHWSEATLAPPPSYENAACMPQLSSSDHWSSRAHELSNEEPPPESNGIKTTSFIEEPKDRKSKGQRYAPVGTSPPYVPYGASRLGASAAPAPSYALGAPKPWQPAAEAPIASMEEDLTDAEIDDKKLKPALKPALKATPPARVEAIEMQNIHLHDMERAEPPEDEIEAYECTSLGWFNCCGTIVVRMYGQLCTAHSTYSRTKRILGIFALVMLVCTALFVGVFSASFEYVNYYHIALKKSRMIGAVDRDHVIYPGCYVLGPDVDLIYFDSTAQTVSSRVSVFTADKLVIDVDISLQYFLRPEEVGKLHAKFSTDYHEVLEQLMFNSIKNEGTKHSLQTYRLNRPELERVLFEKVRERLGGNCCPSCCPKKCADLVDMNTCSICKPADSCDEAYHIDIKYFQLGRVIIPTEVFERYMKQIILLIENERENFFQEHAVVVKETARAVGQIKNDAAEVRANATAYSETIRLVSEAEKEATVQLSYIKALKQMYTRLNFTNEDHKTSLMMMRAFDDIKDNLYSYDYEKATLRD